MTFNTDILFKIHKLRKDNSERYCFPLRMFLGENGLYENHPLKGKIFIKKETGEEYSVDNVYVHWWKGWYFVALARNSNNSHTSITWNINSDGELGDFTWDDYEQKK